MQRRLETVTGALQLAGWTHEELLTSSSCFGPMCPGSGGGINPMFPVVSGSGNGGCTGPFCMGAGNGGSGGARSGGGMMGGSRGVSGYNNKCVGPECSAKVGQRFN
ncbi:eggshell protein 2A-like [Dreissena polymorpha]|uniref:eggshell protein 2A-like n=1 Tax=Dreissena polymorpha TaxID=45954 RepID=UPI002263E93E|nr:eggshell protein 2A-like [Dreissena polymorpha]